MVAEQLKSAHLHETQLEQELGFKKKQLTTNALNLLQKNRILEELKEKINQIRMESDGKMSGNLNKLQRTIGYSLTWIKIGKRFENILSRYMKIFLRSSPVNILI